MSPMEFCQFIKCSCHVKNDWQWQQVTVVLQCGDRWGTQGISRVGCLTCQSPTTATIIAEKFYICICQKYQFFLQFFLANSITFLAQYLKLDCYAATSMEMRRKQHIFRISLLEKPLDDLLSNLLLISLAHISFYSFIYVSNFYPTYITCMIAWITNNLLCLMSFQV